MSSAKTLNISQTSQDLEVIRLLFCKERDKEDFAWLVSKQTSANAQPVLSCEPEKSHLLQPSFGYKIIE